MEVIDWRGWKQDGKHERFVTGTYGRCDPSYSLEAIVEKLEEEMHAEDEAHPWDIDWKLPVTGFPFAAEIRTGVQAVTTPESVIAKVWEECFGRNPLPIGLSERSELIERCKGDPELGRHIRAWEELKESGAWKREMSHRSPR